MTEPRRPDVLIVDDEPSWREVLEVLLLPEEYSLRFASSGIQALEEARGRCPDLVLLDVMMPGMDGFQVCRALREQRETGEVPVVMITALEDRQSRIAGVEAGADDFVSKPFDRMELRARIRTILKLDRFRRLCTERSRFQKLIERSREGYLILDPRGRVSFANPTARTLLELPDLSPPSFLLEEWLEQEWVRRPLGEVEGRAPGACLLVRPRREGAPPVWLCLDRPLDEAEPSEERVFRVRDVSAEMGLCRSRGTFQVLVNHKLRTPLSAALAGVQVLQGRRDGKEDPCLRAVSSSLERLAAEIRGVLAYTEALGGSGSGVPFPLAELESLVEGLRVDLGLADPVDCALETSLEEATVPLSREVLQTLLAELLGNAVKFHPRGVPRLELEARREGDRGVLLLRDDGVRLSPGQLGRVFLPYFQGERGFTGETAGMGLGLSLVEVLVLEAGGRCVLTNREDRPGVQVRLELPLQERA